MTELFIKYLKGHVGDIYVWGAQGETNITEKWIRRRETGEKNAERAIALWEKRKAEEPYSRLRLQRADSQVPAGQ